MKLKSAVFCAIIALGLVAGAYATDWYQIKVTTGNNYELYRFYWKYYKIEDQSGNSRNYNYNTTILLAQQSISVGNVFTNILAILTVGAALLLATIVYQGCRILFKIGKGSNICRIIGVIISVGAMVLLAVAFFELFSITKAFQQDKWEQCETSLISGQYTDLWCGKLLGTYTDKGLITTTVYDWKPDIGWWLTLAALVVSAFVIGGVMRSKRT